MYDEFDNKENEDRYDPKQPSAEDEVKTGQMYGEEDQLSETEEVQASTAEETEASAESGEQSSVYHYSYERGEQAEPTGSTQNVTPNTRPNTATHPKATAIFLPVPNGFFPPLSSECFCCG